MPLVMEFKACARKAAPTPAKHPASTAPYLNHLPRHLWLVANSAAFQACSRTRLRFKLFSCYSVVVVVVAVVVRVTEVQVEVDIVVAVARRRSSSRSSSSGSGSCSSSSSRVSVVDENQKK